MVFEHYPVRLLCPWPKFQCSTAQRHVCELGRIPSTRQHVFLQSRGLVGCGGQSFVECGGSEGHRSDGDRSRLGLSGRLSAPPCNQTRGLIDLLSPAVGCPVLFFQGFRFISEHFVVKVGLPVPSHFHRVGHDAFRLVAVDGDPCLMGAAHLVRSEPNVPLGGPQNAVGTPDDDDVHGPAHRRSIPPKEGVEPQTLPAKHLFDPTISLL
mmetsp:Transcript_41814/g.82570  ORF Transcript_41814/g.82570 Transcript_41814/m.82570 type:complete len:209 (-) Transcript_41814:315-941(-)